MKNLQLTTFLFVFTFQIDAYLGYQKGPWPLFKLCTKSKHNGFVDITKASTKSQLKSAGFDLTKRTYLIIHGFTDNLDFPAPDDWQKRIKNNILKKEDANVILVDWKYGAGLYNDDGSALPEGITKRAFYKEAANNTGTVGKRTAEFLKQNGIHLDNTHCIGHSLGAQCCGFTGKYAPGLDRITGLDPAAPFFSDSILNKPADVLFDVWPAYLILGDSLTKEKAMFVDIIHTSLFFGIQEPVGHQDFYVSWQEPCQPGCKPVSKQDFSCDHVRAVNLYAESILSPKKFKTSTVCNFWPTSYNLGLCDCKSKCNHMGHYADRAQSQGNYYLETNDATPFSLT